MSNDCFVFQEELHHSQPETGVADGVPLKFGKVLSVDDDINYQQSLCYSLRNLVINGQPIELLTVNSAAEAASVLTHYDDIAIILLDVVMEQDDAGLRLVDTIRNVLGDSLVRIILLTGQPGMAPRKEVMLKYDINEYWNKSEIDHDTLRAVVTANLRSWESMYELDQARMGLQMVVDASRHLASKYDPESFIQVVIKEIGQLIGGENELTLCVVRVQSGSTCENASFVTGLGIDKLGDDGALPEWLCCEFSQLCEQALKEHNHQFNRNHSVLYFSGDRENSYCYLVMVYAEQNLSAYHIYLLQVFSENISSGFMQLALINQLSKLAYQDTDLHINNRNWLLRELNTMNASELNDSELIVLEIDQFDTHAVSFNESLLLDTVIAVYNTIDQTLNHALAITRISIDCFVVLYNKHESPTDEMLIRLMNQKYQVRGYTVRCTLTLARIELALIDDLPALQKLHLAKSLIFFARQEGVGFITYQPWYRERLLGDYRILGDLMTAIDNHDFYLVFQPKVNIHDGRTVGLEALIRWKKDSHILAPGDFIPIAERTGLIAKIDPLVVHLVANAIRELENAGFMLPISFNTTAKELMDPEYIRLLLDLVEVEHIRPELIDIEITETQAMESYEKINPILKCLHDVGIRITIDDFGTGYSSLAHISQLFADTVKIDIVFVKHLHEDKASQKVVELVMNLASLLGFSVVAEGIETEAQQAALIERNCLIGQGFLYAKPMPIDEFILWLKRHGVAS